MARTLTMFVRVKSTPNNLRQSVQIVQFVRVGKKAQKKEVYIALYEENYRTSALSKLVIVGKEVGYYNNKVTTGWNYKGGGNYAAQHGKQQILHITPR